MKEYGISYDMQCHGTNSDGNPMVSNGHLIRPVKVLRIYWLCGPLGLGCIVQSVTLQQLKRALCVIATNIIQDRETKTISTAHTYGFTKMYSCCVLAMKVLGILSCV